MDEIHWLGEYNEIEDVFTNLEEVLPLAVKMQREGGDTNGALNALTPVINTAIGTDTPPNSRASFMRASLLEKAFDKARLIYKRANMPHEAVASGMVSYFMGIKRMTACADFDAAQAAEQRSSRYQELFCHDEEDRKEAEQRALDYESYAKEGLVQATARLTDAFILAEAERLLKQMKLDVALAKNILAAVSQPPHNPWELFNVVMSALGH